MKKIYTLLAMLMCMVTTIKAVDFTLSGNNTSGYLVLQDSKGDAIAPASASGEGTYNAKYSFTGVAEGTYTIVGKSSQNQEVINGTAEITIDSESQGQTYDVCTVTTGINNSGWVMGTDWNPSTYTVTTSTQKARKCTLGESTTANRVCVLLLKGDSYTLDFTLSEERLAQNYVPAQASGTVTSPSSSSGVSCEQFGYYTVTLESDMDFTLGWKTGSPKAANGGTHFIPLNNIEPTVKNLDGGRKELTFKLTDKYYYIYHATKPGHRTMKGFFCFYATETDTQKNPTFDLSESDFGENTPDWMNHDATAHSGSNVADIFLNVNERGYISMNTGDEMDIFGMRNWQMINSIMNYYVDPDFHYTVINENGQQDNSVITFDKTSTTWNPWVKMKAVGKGTAIVLVTYDACKTKIHKTDGTTSDFYFNDKDGEWSALWPENTGVYVVTVDQDSSKVVTNMKNAEGLNVIKTGANAGKPTRYAAENVDAELDVFYYTPDQEGYSYSFTPENAVKVEIAYPVIGETMTTFNGFAETGVSKDNEGKYSVLLKEGTNIVRLTDASGNATYQVLRAKRASYEIVNETRPGKTPQAGDKLKVQYSGLYHPCNKLSGIYNMTAAIVYQGVANDNSIVGGSGQYNFGGTLSAQAFSISIPSDYDAEANPVYSIGTGLLRSSGFGSAYGAHRYITRENGATPNMNATVGTAFFGQLPEIALNVAIAKKYGIKFDITPAEADAKVIFKNSEGTVIEPDAEGYYYGIYGKYTYTITADGYKCVNDKLVEYQDDTQEKQTIAITLDPLGENDWNGKDMTEPKKADGYYLVTTGAELAWVANDINVNKNYTDSISIQNDFDLGSYPWTPMGGVNTSTAYQGAFLGNGHTISGLYVNETRNYVGLFGQVKGNISGITVNGSVTTTGSYAGGIAGCFQGAGYQNEEDWRTLSDCVNHATVTAKTYAGGIAGSLTTGGKIDKVYNDAAITATNTSLTQGYAGGIVGNVNGMYGYIYNAYNLGNVTAMCYVGGIAGSENSSAVAENLYNLGEITATTTNASYTQYCGSIFGSNTSNYSKVKNLFAAKSYIAEKNTTIVEAEAFKTGGVAYQLGKAFGQNIGKDDYPTLGTFKVYTDGETYFNNNPAYDELINFEDVDLAGATFYNGSDGAGLISTKDDFSFLNYYDTKYYSWNGFAASATVSDVFNGYADDSQYNSCTGGGMESKQFVIGYFSEYNFYMDDQQPAIYATKNMKPEYAYITNTANAYLSMLNGDAYAKKFTPEDKLTLTITGMTEDDDETGKVVFYLATDGNIVNEWTKVDLTPLGVVDHIVFSMTSTDTDYGFANTPLYFCLDNMKIELTDEEPTAISTVKEVAPKTLLNGKFLENGRIVIVKNGKKFSANGAEIK